MPYIRKGLLANRELYEVTIGAETEDEARKLVAVWETLRGQTLAGLAAARARTEYLRTVDDVLITMNEAAKLAGVSPGYLYAHAKELPFCKRVGSRVRISKAGLKEWLLTR